MSESLSSFINKARQRGVQLAGKQKQALTKAIQQSGKGAGGKKITAQEIAKARKTFVNKGGTDYLATVGQTYAANQLAGSARKKLAKKGFAQNEAGYYTKLGDITKDVLNKTLGAGYSEDDIRAVLAKDFAKTKLDDEVGKFLGEGGGYRLNKDTGMWEKVGLTSGLGETPGTPSITGELGPYAGIDPDAALGATPAEMDYATAIDPQKIAAKSRERVARLQQATDLLGRRMAYGAEYDLSKLNRVQALQQAGIQQANYLYNLIPSAFN
jgi:hypothetical protein